MHSASDLSQKRVNRWRPVAACAILFLLNVYICRELFSIEFIGNLDSNEGVFVALSRFYRENFMDQRWFPWFNCGVPIENAYQPLLPVLAAAAGWASGWSVEHAFHFVLALAYCLGPVALFWFAWEWSGSFALSLTAGLAYSLTSFAQMLIPILRVRDNGHWAPLRLFNLVHYAEDPHNVSLALLPLALLFLLRICRQRTAGNFVGAVLSCAAVVLANAFGAVDLAIGGLCIVLALERGYVAMAVTGVASYLLISSWLPPSLIALIGADQWTARGGFFHAGTGPLLSGCAVLLLFAGLWWLTGRLRPVERFSVLFAPWMCAFPIAYFLFDITLVPQGNRYQLELEMAMCLVAGVVVARLLENLRYAGQVAVIGVLAVAGVRQAKTYRHYAHGLIQPVEITQTIEYKIVHWLQRNLPGQRAMIAGDVQFLNNVISNNPQMGGGHEPTVPNWMDRVAVYTIYSGTGAADKDAEYSIFWLKAFGAQAVTVSGEKSREHYHGTVHPHKFDGVLPVLWHEEDDTIYAVPQRSPSLAHVMPREAIPTRAPIHGLDTDPVRPYVTALDNPELPLADFQWRGNSHFSVRAPMKRGQLLSVQVNYMPGWQATVGGRPIRAHGDSIGLLVLEPDCEGDCRVEAAYGLTTEAWVCRILSGFMCLVLMVLAGFGIFGAVHKARSLQPWPH